MDKNIVLLRDIPVIVQKNSNAIQVVGESAHMLSQAAQLGMPIPAGFSVTTTAFKKYVDSGMGDLPDEIWHDIERGLHSIEEATGKIFSGADPLFLSCYTNGPERGVLNIGLNDYTVRRLETSSKNRAFVWDSYRRLIKSYGVLVHHIPDHEFDDLFIQYRLSRNLMTISQFTALDFIQVTKLYRSVIVRFTGKPFPQEPLEQLRNIVLACYRNYFSESCACFRAESHIDPSIGVSILLMQMQFSAANENSAAVAIASHDFATGDAIVNGNFAIESYVDDVCEEIIDVIDINSVPPPFDQTVDIVKRYLDKAVKFFKEPMMMKCAISDGRVFVLTLSSMRFVAFARLHAVREMIASGILTKKEAITRLHPGSISALLAPHIPNKPKTAFVSGVGAAFGTTTGIVTIDHDECIKNDKNTILIVTSLSVLDLTAVASAAAVITVEGGHFSYAAGILRRMVKPAAIGCKGLLVDIEQGTIENGNMACALGEEITVDTGDVFQTPLPSTVPESIDNPDAAEVMKWIDEIRQGKLSVNTAVTSQEEIQSSLIAGADAFGLLNVDSLLHEEMESVVKYILHVSDDLREEIASRLASHFCDVFAACANREITIALLDSPFDYMPPLEQINAEVAGLKVCKQFESGFDRDEELEHKQALLTLLQEAHESNPMMGLRGCRLNLMIPGLVELQARAAISGIHSARRRGVEPVIRFALPECNDWHEAMRISDILKNVLADAEINAEIGAMIHSPRACMNAKDIAKYVDFIIFDVDTLHELTFGMCKEDAEHSFLHQYLDWGVISVSPFNCLDQSGVGELMKMAIDDMKEVKNDIQIGITGHNCIDQASVMFCYNLGVNSITCTPEIVPSARLSAAKVVIASE